MAQGGRLRGKKVYRRTFGAFLKMLQKNMTLRVCEGAISGAARKHHVIEKWEVRRARGDNKKGDPKNGGISQDVIENEGRKKRCPGISLDVIDNKCVTRSSLDVHENK